MQYRQLGKTGMSALEIGYGGGRVTAKQNQKESIGWVHQTLDQGINYIGTVPNCGNGF